MTEDELKRLLAVALAARAAEEAADAELERLERAVTAAEDAEEETRLRRKKAMGEWAAATRAAGVGVVVEGDFVYVPFADGGDLVRHRLRPEKTEAQ